MALGLNDEACPVSLDVSGAVYRAGGLALDELLDTIPEATRARLAVYLYGRSHTHERGLRVAATCEGSTLRRACGLLGNTVYAVSRQPFEAPSHGAARIASSRKVSLAGSFA